MPPRKKAPLKITVTISEPVCVEIGNKVLIAGHDDKTGAFVTIQREKQ